MKKNLKKQTTRWIILCRLYKDIFSVLYISFFIFCNIFFYYFKDVFLFFNERVLQKLCHVYTCLQYINFYIRYYCRYFLFINNVFSHKPFHILLFIVIYFIYRIFIYIKTKNNELQLANWLTKGINDRMTDLECNIKSD